MPVEAWLGRLPAWDLCPGPGVIRLPMPILRHLPCPLPGKLTRGVSSVLEHAASENGTHRLKLFTGWASFLNRPIVDDDGTIRTEERNLASPRGVLGPAASSLACRLGTSAAVAALSCAPALPVLVEPRGV